MFDHEHYGAMKRKFDPNGAFPEYSRRCARPLAGVARAAARQVSAGEAKSAASGAARPDREREEDRQGCARRASAAAAVASAQPCSAVG